VESLLWKNLRTCRTSTTDYEMNEASFLQTSLDYQQRCEYPDLAPTMAVFLNLCKTVAPVNSFFIRRGPGPNRFTGQNFSNFLLSSYIQLT